MTPRLVHYLITWRRCGCTSWLTVHLGAGMMPTVSECHGCGATWAVYLDGKRKARA